MKKEAIGILTGILTLLLALFLFTLLLSFGVFAAKMDSSNYKQSVAISVGGENASSSSFRMNTIAGIINVIISSSSYISRLGFFHTLLLADGQPCSSATQCEGGFCCSSLCQSSDCPTAAAAGGGGGGAAAGGGGGELPKIEEPRIKDFSLSPSSIKEQLTIGDTKTLPIIIQNTGNTALNFALSVAAVSEFVSLLESRFVLQPDEQKTVEAAIVGKKFGSYIGEIEILADGIKKSISVLIEVESAQVLFDVKLDIPSTYKEVEAGGELRTQVTLLNIGPSKRVDVTPTYIIKDKHGRIVDELSERFTVEKQLSYSKSFRIPKESQPGDYLAVVELKYEDSFAVSSDLFKVVLKKLSGRRSGTEKILMLGGLAAFVVAIVLVMYFVIRKRYKT